MSIVLFRSCHVRLGCSGARFLAYPGKLLQSVLHQSVYGSDRIGPIAFSLARQVPGQQRNALIDRQHWIDREATRSTCLYTSSRSMRC